MMTCLFLRIISASPNAVVQVSHALVDVFAQHPTNATILTDAGEIVPLQPMIKYK
jgi:hypothetical protein